MGTDLQKNPMIAGVLSGLVPGLGQLYCRQWVKGAACLGAMSVVDVCADVSKSLIAFLMSRLLPENMAAFFVGSLLMVVIAAWSVLDAVRTAQRTSG